MINLTNIQPHFGSEELRCFNEYLSKGNCYLEYGAGGSTVHACSFPNIRQVISIETDENWLQKVIESVENKEKLIIEHCDIGKVGQWGTPLEKSKYQEFWKYMVHPWRIAKLYHTVPDVALIDGRFRVASFLYSLVSARIGTNILFDDYVNRPDYHVVEEFCKLTDIKGRMGVFSVNNNFSLSELIAAIAKYSVISH